MTVVLRYGRAAVSGAGRASSRRGPLPIESFPTPAFGYLLFRPQRPDRQRERTWSSLVASIALLSPPVKAFIEGSSMPIGPRKLTRTTVRRMRVADLRDELTQRDLETTGTRPVLESRLIEALEQEGLLSTRTTTRNDKSQATRPSCKQELPLAGDKQIDPSRTYILRVTAKVASFSVEESGAGMLLCDSETLEEVWAARQYFATRRTSFESTYCALVMALRHCREQGVRKIILEISNDIMADQLTGKMVVTKRPMKRLYWTVLDLLTSMEHFEVKYVPKELNSRAENLAEKAVATKRSIGISSNITDPLIPFQVEDPDEVFPEPNDATSPNESKATNTKATDPTIPAASEASKLAAIKTTKPTQDESPKSLVTPESGIDPTKLYLLKVDGGSRNNPGNAGVGMVLYDEHGIEIWCGWKFLGMGISNNVAEYTALLIGLQCVASLGIRRLQAESDSELVVKQLRGLYQVKNHGLKPIYRDVKDMMSQFDFFDLRHIPRRENARADELANHAMNEKSTYGFDDS